MDADQPQSSIKIDNDAYLKIWQIEQDHSRSAWTLTTFFMSVSFAIFGFSFQQQLASSGSLALRISALFIYWLALVIKWRFFGYNKILRAYLVEMETSGRTSFDIQGTAKKTLYSGFQARLSSYYLLLYVGVFYAVGVVLLWFLHV